MKRIKVIWILAVFLPLVQASAAGVERATPWSGRHGGKAGAAVSTSEGSESLYFNPARLGKVDYRQTLSIDFSPTWAQFQAPLGEPENSYTSEYSLSPVFGMSYGYKLSERWAVALGSHVLGGSNIEYTDVAYGDYSQGEIKNFLSVVEVALGGSYQLSSAWSVGLAWRATILQQDLSQVHRVQTPEGLVAVQTHLTNLKGESSEGFRLGINYEPSTRWGLGLTYRSGVNLSAQGAMDQAAYLEAGGKTPASAPYNQSRADSQAEVKATLPQALTFGGHYRPNENWTLFGEYSWINSSVVERFEILAESYEPLDGEMHWADQHILRIAAESTKWKLPLRLGYAFSTAVANRSHMSASSPGSGNGHSLSVGTSAPLDEGLTVHGALGFYYDSSSVRVSDQVQQGIHPPTPGVGRYRALVFPVVHLGMTYSF